MADEELGRVESGCGCVNLMACQTWNDGLEFLCRIFQFPRPLSGKGSDEVLYMVVVKHSVTAKTFSRHLLHLIMLWIEKNVLIGDRMPTRLPVSETARVTLAAGLLQGQHPGLSEVTGFFGGSRTEMLHDSVGVLG